MPRLSIRITESQERDLEARAREVGWKVSELVRFILFPPEPVNDPLEDHERRIARLEEMAGL